MSMPCTITLEVDVHQAKKARVDYPEATTLRDNMEMVANTIQGNILFANELESVGIFTLLEKRQFTDPNSSHELIYTQRMLDEVGVAMNGGCNPEEVFNDFIEILVSIGGPVKTIAQFLKGCSMYNEYIFILTVLLFFFSIEQVEPDPN